MTKSYQVYVNSFLELLKKCYHFTKRDCFALWAIISTIIGSKSFSLKAVSDAFGRKVGRNFIAEVLKNTPTYREKWRTFPLNLIAFVVIAIGLYLISQLIADFFPFIRRILNVIFLPFAVTHVWFHVNAIHELNRHHLVKSTGSSVSVTPFLSVNSPVSGLQ